MTERRKLTPVTQKRFVEAVDKGVRSLTLRCSWAGISVATYNAWWAAWQSGDDPEQRELDEFFTAIEQARVRRNMQYLTKMRTAGAKDWRMWRTLLRMVDPEEYPEQPLALVTTTAIATAQQMTDEELSDRFAVLLERVERERTRGDAQDPA